MIRVSKAFRRIADDAGMPDVSPHTPRHAAITWAMRRGTQRYDASDCFGVSEKVLERAYGHHDPEHHREVTQRMDRRQRVSPVAQPVAKWGRGGCASLRAGG